MKINAKGLSYKELNQKLYSAVEEGHKKILLQNVNGQRYIASGLKSDIKIIIEGVPGNDLGSFMDGPEIFVRDNGQDCIANTMNGGKIVINGSAGDILGYGMRGGYLYIKENVGYRVGIHIKAYKELLPVIIVGGSAYDYFGEYMAGGVMILLGLNGKKGIVGNFIGTGMHGGVIYIRGSVKKYQLGKELGVGKWTNEDKIIFRKYVTDFCSEFDINPEKIFKNKFTKLVPISHRPYGRLYAY